MGEKRRKDKKERSSYLDSQINDMLLLAMKKDWDMYLKIEKFIQGLGAGAGRRKNRKEVKR